MKLALNSGIQTYQILTNDDEVCIPSLSSILLALMHIFCHQIGNGYCDSTHFLSLPEQSTYLQPSLQRLDSNKKGHPHFLLLEIFE